MQNLTNVLRSLPAINLFIDQVVIDVKMILLAGLLEELALKTIYNNGLKYTPPWIRDSTAMDEVFQNEEYFTK